MKITLDLSGLAETHWHHYAIRFVFGGLVTIATGLIAHSYGPVVGGLFLAFPAILPASLTLVAQHQREKKAHIGMRGERRGRLAAAIDALGATCGSLGLFAFGAVTWQVATRIRPSLALSMATIAWFALGFAVWRVRRP
jgi:hypothetical protein